jgi:hypothetical protein
MSGIGMIVIEPSTHELTPGTFGYTLFALMMLSAWAIIGSCSHTTTEDVALWSLFHQLTPVVVGIIAIISILLLYMDFF